MAKAKSAQQPTNQNESDDDDDENENEDKRRNRAPSPFHSQSKVTISVHEDLSDDIAGTFDLHTVSTLLANHFAELGYGTRLVSRKRAEAKVPGIPGAMLYIAAKDYEFPATAERGIRLDSETANEVKAAAAALGIDVNDKDALIKMLRSLAQAAKKSATK